MSRTVVIALVLIAASPFVLLVAGCGVWAAIPSTFTLTNESGRDIRRLSVSIGGKTHRYENIPAGGEVSGSFHFSNEEAFDVQGQFADGSELGDHCGYLLWQDFEQHRVMAVRPDGMVDLR